jgi:hypothetical protein
MEFKMAAKRKRKGSSKIGRASKACKGKGGKMARKKCMKAWFKKHK